MNMSGGSPADYDHLFKLLLIGNSGVGKSSILLRFADDTFDPEQAVTIGVDFKTVRQNFAGKRLNLTLWDTAGQEKFRALTSSYYRATHGIIVVYDVTNRGSFDAISTWLDEIDMYATSSNVVKLLVGNKIDLESREVSRDEALAFARSKAMVYIETSAKTKDGIQTAFNELVQKILDTPDLAEDSRPKDRSGAVNMGAASNGTEGEAGLCGC